MFDKYYNILEISSTASDDDIKKAYKKMAIKHHPDKNPDNKEVAEEKFKEVAEAYEVLTNKEKYMKQPAFNRPGGHPGFAGGFVNPHEMFNQIFKEMNIGSQRAPNVCINISSNGQSNSVSRSSSVRIQNGKKIETIQESINGIIRQRVVVTELNPAPNNERVR